MYPKFDPQNLSEECGGKWNDVLQCRIDHPFKRLFAGCLKLERIFSDCLGKEFEVKRLANKAKFQKANDQFKFLKEVHAKKEKIIEEIKKEKRVMTPEEKKENLKKKGDKI
jgi:hypothetical protein